MARGRKKQRKTGAKKVKGQGQTKVTMKRKRAEAAEEEKTNEEEAEKTDVKKQKRDNDTKKPSSKLRCSAYWSVTTKFHPNAANLLSTGGYVTLTGREKRNWGMIKYDLQGNQLDSAIFEFPPDGMTEVTLAKKQCLAVTTGLWCGAGKIRKIDFYDLADLDNLVLSYKVPEHVPGAVCVGPSGVLLYLDDDPYTHEENSWMRWLDCSTSPPKSAEPVNTTVLPKRMVHRFCYLRHEERNLIVTIGDIEHGISAYDAETGKLVWRAKGQFPGMEKELKPYQITTDGRGHLFVVDSSSFPHYERIHVFSTSGEHKGTVLHDEGLGEIDEIKWCNEISSLIVVHKKKNAKVLRLSAFKIK